MSVGCVAGVDSWSACWYVDPTGPAAAAMREVCTVQTNRGQMMPQPIGEHRVGFVAPHGMIWADGHPGGKHALAAPDTLVGAYEKLRASLLEEGVPIPVGLPGRDREGQLYEGFAGIRRLDSTVNLSMETAAEGLSLLAGIAGVVRDMPRVQFDGRWSTDGKQIETVYMRGYSGRNVLARCYDKGVESGLAGAGQLVRMEDQRRFVKETRRGVEELTALYVRQKFRKRFEDLWTSTKGQVVAGPMVIPQKLQEMVDAGELTPTAARNLCGDMFMEAAQQAGERRPSTRTQRRRAAARRKVGLHLADGVLEEVEIDLHDVMTEAMDSAVWGEG